ncbi:MAG: signal peptide peptidase SppA, partial [Cyclobacteriaceae bacterium]
SIIKSIDAAKTDEKIEGIYIETKFIQASFASLQEIRDAILDFKESGKFVYAYGEYISEADYYVASAADSVFLNPEGALEFNGLSANIMFYKGLFDKLEVEPVIFRPASNKFKSYVEPYTRKDMSEENKLQYSELLNSVYDFYLSEVSLTRNIDASILEDISDNMKINYAQDAAEYGLIDQVVYEDEVKAKLRKKLDVEEDRKINFMGISKYAQVVKSKVEGKKEKIAIIVANGAIVPSGDDESVGGEQYARYIREAREDDNIKAIVLRVNSPGGSLLGSDMIWREVMLTKGVKPIITSMAGVAASGGYYIAMATDTIVAQPNTITGSIGIFSMLVNMEEFLDNKIGITHDVVGTGEYSDFITVTREFTPYENEVMQQSVERGYKTFTTKVAEGRGMAVEDVLAIAGGRVWSGLQAKENGLVDVLGSYDDAIAIAAAKAGVEEYSLAMYPRQKPFLEKLMSDLGNQSGSILGKDHILAKYEQQLKALKQLQGIQARMPGELIIE